VPGDIRPSRARYWSAFWIDVNVPLRFVPTFFTTVMIAIEMPAAIRPYSIAVAPDSSRKKRFNTDISVSLFGSERHNRPHLFIYDSNLKKR
jgi:hypothetical protein